MDKQHSDPVAEVAALLADFDTLAAIPEVADVSWFRVLKALAVLAMLSGIPALPPEAQAALEVAARVVGDTYLRGDLEAIRRAVDPEAEAALVELAAALLTAEGGGDPPTKGDLIRTLEERVPTFAARLPQSKRGRTNLLKKANSKRLPQTRGNG